MLFRAGTYPRLSSTWPIVPANPSLHVLPYKEAVRVKGQGFVNTWQPGYLFRTSWCQTLAAESESTGTYEL
jgi:hypothetical protein